MTSDKRGFGLRAAGLVVFIAMAVVIFLALYNTAGGIDIGKRYRFTAVVPTALQLVDNADVKSAGVDIGRVTAVSGRGTTAVLQLEIDPDRGPVHRDAHVAVRAKTAVGENYVDLDPGTTRAPAIPDGGELPLRQARTSVQIDEILSTISRPRQRRLRRLLSGLGPGVADAQDVNDALAGVSGTLTESSRLADTLVTERAAVADLTVDFGTVFAALGERRDAIQRLVRGLRGAATSVASEDDALRAGLRELPGALVSVQRASTHLAAVGGRATPVLEDLTVALDRLAPALRDLPPASRATLGALRRLSSAAPAARTLLRALRKVGGPTTALVPALDNTLRELRPALRYLEPYAGDVGAWFAATGGISQTRDATSSLGRVKGLVSSTTLATLGETERQALQQLLGAGVAKLVTFRGLNPYPKPRTQGQPRAFSGDYPRIQREP